MGPPLSLPLLTNRWLTHEAEPQAATGLRAVAGGLLCLLPWLSAVQHGMADCGVGRNRAAGLSPWWPGPLGHGGRACSSPVVQPWFGARALAGGCAKLDRSPPLADGCLGSSLGVGGARAGNTTGRIGQREPWAGGRLCACGRYCLGLCVAVFVVCPQQVSPVKGWVLPVRLWAECNPRMRPRVVGTNSGSGWQGRAGRSGSSCWRLAFARWPHLHGGQLPALLWLTMSEVVFALGCPAAGPCCVLAGAGA